MKSGFVLLAVAAVFLCFSPASADEMINGVGASFATPVYQAWAHDYDKQTGIKLNYQSIGSGGGIRQIIERTVDFGASDDPLTPERLKRFNLLQFPTMIGGVVLVVNIDGVKEGQMKMDSEAVCKIYLGDITYWDDAKIKGLNPLLKLPHAAISVVYRADASGSTAIFTNYLAGTCKDFKSSVGEGTSVKWPVGIGGKGNEGVTNYVQRSVNSIGYVQFAYAKLNKLTYVMLKNRAGKFVEPGFETFKAAAGSAKFSVKNDFYVWLNNTWGKEAWPITGATFILLAKDRKEIGVTATKFFDWAFKNGDPKVKELVYVPLPKTLKDKIRAYWKANGIY
ncbi:MAG: phosphate ABC transporter substrate-binding protein PstS [Nitrospirae bacterium]|nr:phosphate ABC transporter substrate-binding protein PstS [Nitrospirota bacterium]